MRIGLVSDTHGLLRPEALAALAGVERILHAGDVGAPAVLDALAAIAPVTAVRGNVDVAPPLAALPAQVTIALAGTRIHLLHDLADLAIDPAAEGVAVVVAGHSHRPRVHAAGGVLWVNPGSAGPRRFALPVAVAELRLGPGGAIARIVPLADAPARAARGR
jgi:putative phosphoesterase